MIQVKVLNQDGKMPSRAHTDDAGWDLYTTIDAVLEVGERKLLPTGISMAIPKGYYGRIADRSGNSFNLGLHVLAGVIDSTYRAEIKVLLINLSNKSVEIKIGHRIAQIIITSISNMQLTQVDELDSTDRGVLGFGSSGR